MMERRPLPTGGSASTDRDLYLFDTFSGMTPPTPEDVDSAYDGFSLARMWGAPPARRDELDRRPGCRGARGHGPATGYPAEHVHPRRGPRRADAARARPRAPSRCCAWTPTGTPRRATTWSTSTRRLVTGGVLCSTLQPLRRARRAVDEALTAHGERPLLHRIDYTGRIAVRPSTADDDRQREGLAAVAENRVGLGLLPGQLHPQLFL